MRRQAIVLAAALAMAPLGAKAADLVVWWEEGFYPEEDEAVAEIIAAFEHQTGKKVELVQPAQGESEEAKRRSKPGSRPTSCSGLGGTTRPTSGPTRIGSWTSTETLEPCGSCSIRRLERATLAQRQHGRARPLRAADGAAFQPPPRLAKPSGAGRL